MSSKRVFLITGATGQQGGAVVDALLSSPARQQLTLRALTRKPDSPSALKLAKRGVELIQGSSDSRESLVRALDGVEGAFLVTMPFGHKQGVAHEVEQGKTFVDAAKESGLKTLVFSSINRAEASGVPHFESKAEIERHIAGTGSFAHTTILRTVAFMDNFPRASSLASFMGLGVFGAALKDNKRVQLLAVSDIGKVAANALLEPEVYAERSPIDMAGDELSVAEMQRAYGHAQGGKVAWRAWMPGSVLSLMPHDLGAMFKWFASTGFNVDVPAARIQHDLLTFEDWLRQKSE